jgi:hypothetical protein
MGALFRLLPAAASCLAVTAIVALEVSSNERLGHGAGLVTDVVVQRHVTAAPSEYTVKLWRREGGSLQSAGSLPVIRSQGLSVSGPVQPSPDGVHFALHTRESEGLGEPIVDRVYAMDRNSKPFVRASGYRDPVWSGPDTLVMAGEDGLFKIVLGAGSTQERIGPRGLGVADSPPLQPAVSPDGRTIAFIQGDALWRIGMNGAGLTRLTRPQPGVAWPAWSPDGTRIALVASACPPVGAGSPAPDIVLVSATASNQELRDAGLVMRRGSVPARSCGPLYWNAG